MKRVPFGLVTAASTLLLTSLITSMNTSHAQVREGVFGVGNPDAFLRKYLAFRTGQLRSSAPHLLRVRLGYVKGLSRSFTGLAGEIALDLQSGTFRVSLNGLTPRQAYSLWLVDVAEPGAEPATDTSVRLANVTPTSATALVAGDLSRSAQALPPGFAIDRVVVATGTSSPAAVLATGSVNVFQKIFFRRLSLRNEGTGTTLFQETTAAPTLSSRVSDLEAQTDAALALTETTPRLLQLASTFASTESTATSTRSVRLDRLVSRGATLFFEGTFGGNGRTCGTCHPASNNFTIDPDFISTLPASDPLFVAEFNPALAQLERPKLMRSYGLILENLDGLDDPTRKFVMRGVPPTLGLQVTLERDASLVNAPVQMTGWSGDGAPGTGSLREFAIGAVTQHLTKRLARVPGRDFRLPTEHQLDAMEAFQLSLGRYADYDLSRVKFLNADVDAGRSLFMNGTGDPNAGGSCGFCHGNAGALSANGQNRNFNTNVEDAQHLARGIEAFPKDGGFGQTGNPDGTYGDRSFNISSVVEAADTGPFFHNNLVDTLEDVVEFYSGPEFNAPRAPSARINFNATQVAQVAGFMRGVNVLQNIDIARREIREILTSVVNARGEQETRLQTAREETSDAIDVLREGNLFAAAVTHLTAARDLAAQALRSTNATERRKLAQQADARLGQARGAIATVP